jgi:hypothetical protein
LTEIIARGPQGRVNTWVEPAFREVLRENGTFFRGAKCGEYGIFREAKNGTFSRSEKWRKIVFFALRNASKNGPVLGCELGRAYFSRFFLKKNFEKKFFFRGAKCGEKMALCCWRKWRKMALSKRNLSEINRR